MCMHICTLICIYRNRISTYPYTFVHIYIYIYIYIYINIDVVSVCTSAFYIKKDLNKVEENDGRVA